MVVVDIVNLNALICNGKSVNSGFAFLAIFNSTGTVLTVSAQSSNIVKNYQAHLDSDK